MMSAIEPVVSNQESASPVNSQLLEWVEVSLQDRLHPMYISGDVTIHPKAMVSPGVILQAAPNSRIAIGERACIGMGATIKAFNGTIAIEDDAVIGAGVLIIGRAIVGRHACVGTASTIYNSSIESLQVVPAGSLVGDPTASVGHPATHPAATNGSVAGEDSSPDRSANGSMPEAVSTDKPARSEDEALPDLWTTPPEPSRSPAGSTETKPPEANQPTEAKPPETESTESTGNSSPSSDDLAEPKTTELETTEESAPDAGPKTVYGQVYVSQILYTIFPQGKSPNRRSTD
jgi:carbon dioxide concentrating mechanism protein CcmN